MPWFRQEQRKPQEAQHIDLSEPHTRQMAVVATQRKPQAAKRMSLLEPHMRQVTVMAMQHKLLFPA